VSRRSFSSVAAPVLLSFELPLLAIFYAKNEHVTRFIKYLAVCHEIILSFSVYKARPVEITPA